MSRGKLDPNKIPLSLYIHLPWCETKCPYCDFNSHALKGRLPEREYVDALLRDLELDLEENAQHLSARRIETIFIGGGTPSLVSGDEIQRLLSSIKQRVTCADAMEITLEANPGSGNYEQFLGYRNAGVNRLSIGIQSFHDEYLHALGRIHTSAQALSSITAAKSAGFKNLNIDLMFGLPQQSLDDARLDLARAIECDPAHLSCYQLTIEPNTWFHSHPPVLPDDDLIWEMQEHIVRGLSRAGFAQYEVSAFARDKNMCRHNVNYWRFGDYLGIGAGAHGKVTGPDGVKRVWKIKHPRRYLQYAGTHKQIGGKKQIHEHELVLEFMLNALRLREPVRESFFSERTGLSVESIEAMLLAAKQAGLLDWDNGVFSASERGYRYLNFLLDHFAPKNISRRPPGELPLDFAAGNPI